ncbi:methyl-accepting chemotaxis protein [Thiorhodospira sibirica]|uniref:methyl-accepting chemotaxis protein n=1 Tax=Thiorhodospira sibirica TaxID=154347 RepID=UPI00022C22C2|nr:methyl-accepting chemotaxis protein [Thiorhodospira sibirica]
MNLAAYQSLKMRIRMGLALVLLVLILVITGVIFFQGEPRMVRQTQQLIEQAGLSLQVQLQQQLTVVETLTMTLADLWATLPKEAALYHQVFPPLLDQHGNPAIAGGGIWPEPRVFDSEVVRRSFFWAREQGRMVYLDDYNDPAGSGYHQEDWYQAGRGRDASQGCVWSPAYTDPHSQAPMVTCTVALRAGAFAGVATLDVDLGGLNALLAEQGQITGGYALLFDQTGQLLAFPASLAPMIRVERDQDFMSRQALLEALPGYQRVQTLFQERKQPSAGVRIAKDPVLNVSTYAHRFTLEETGWHIVLVTPWSRMVGEARALTWTLLAYVVPLMVVSIILALWASQRLLDAINQTTERIRQLANPDQGQSKQRLPTQRNDEIGALQQAVNAYADFFQRLLDEIAGYATALSNEAKTLAQFSDGLSARAQTQNEANELLLSAVTEMAGRAHEVAEHTQESTHTSAASQSLVRTGRRLVQENHSTISVLAQLMDKTQSMVTQLQDDSEQVGVILNVIKGIADQTNLLALNAAIEAARAGERGRGFAVVAEEVHRLAIKSQQSTENIERIIHGLQGASKQTVTAMRQGREQTLASVTQANDAVSALEDIASAFATLTELATRIDELAHAQAEVARHVNDTMNAQQDSEQTLRDSQRMREIGQRIDILAKELDAATFNA